MGVDEDSGRWVGLGSAGWCLHQAVLLYYPALDHALLVEHYDWVDFCLLDDRLVWEFRSVMGSPVKPWKYLVLVEVLWQLWRPLRGERCFVPLRSCVRCGVDQSIGRSTDTFFSLVEGYPEGVEQE